MTPAERLAELERGENPRLVARMQSGFAVMAESQFLPGYCLLLAAPQVGQLLDLDPAGRSQFLNDMARLGEAVRNATGAVRCNFAIYGNVDPFLHAHVWPRFVDEDPEYATTPPLAMPSMVRDHPSNRWSYEKHAGLLSRIRSALAS